MPKFTASCGTPYFACPNLLRVVGNPYGKLFKKLCVQTFWKNFLKSLFDTNSEFSPRCQCTPGWALQPQRVHTDTVEKTLEQLFCLLLRPLVRFHTPHVERLYDDEMASLKDKKDEAKAQARGMTQRQCRWLQLRSRVSSHFGSSCTALQGFVQPTPHGVRALLPSR